MREPSASRSCSDVVGNASSTPIHSPADELALAAAAEAAAAALLLDAPPLVRVWPRPVKAEEALQACSRYVP